jgi:hypothetical protein
LPGSTYYWELFNFRTANGHQIKNCILEYGGSAGATNHEDCIIKIQDKANITLENVIVRNSYNYGITYHPNGGQVRLTHSNVTFANNVKGNVQYYNGSTWVVVNELP